MRRRVGLNVRKFLAAQGLSQEELAFECGLHRTYVSGVERGVRNPTVVVLEKIAKALKVAASRLLSESWLNDGRLGMRGVCSPQFRTCRCNDRGQLLADFVAEVIWRPPPKSDSVALTWTFARSGDDGSAQPGSGAVVLLLQS